MVLLQSDATLFESLRRLQLMQLSVSTLKVQNGYCLKLYELCGVSVSSFCWLLLFGFLIFGAVYGRLLRLGGLLIGCGSTTHSRFATSCALSLSKLHVPLLNFELKG